jgi:hypothetical protein
MRLMRARRVSGEGSKRLLPAVNVKLHPRRHTYINHRRGQRSQIELVPGDVPHPDVP